MNLAFDTTGRLLVVSYAGAGTGTVYALDPARPGAPPAWLEPRPAQPVAGAPIILPVGDWRLASSDPSGVLPARTHQYVAPDGRTVVSATRGFVEGQVSWGVKSADLIRAFGLQQSAPGERVYLTSEAEAATYSARVAADGSVTDLRLFVQQGGEGLTVDRAGQVYIAAGDVFVYSPQGALLAHRRPGAPDQPRVRGTRGADALHHGTPRPVRGAAARVRHTRRPNLRRGSDPRPQSVPS